MAIFRKGTIIIRAIRSQAKFGYIADMFPNDYQLSNRDYMRMKGVSLLVQWKFVPPTSWQKNSQRIKEACNQNGSRLWDEGKVWSEN